MKKKSIAGDYLAELLEAKEESPMKTPEPTATAPATAPPRPRRREDNGTRAHSEARSERQETPGEKPSAMVGVSWRIREDLLNQLRLKSAQRRVEGHETWQLQDMFGQAVEQWIKRDAR